LQDAKRYFTDYSCQFLTTDQIDYRLLSADFDSFISINF